MDDLIAVPEENKLVAALHTEGVELPLPFEQDIFLLGIQVAGPEYRSNIDALYNSLDIEERVRLVREPNNPYDEFAIRIEIEDGDTAEDPASGQLVADGGISIGYVPRAYNKPFARLMDAGKYLYGVIRHKELINGSYHKIVVKIYMKD